MRSSLYGYWRVAPLSDVLLARIDVFQNPQSRETCPRSRKKLLKNSKGGTQMNDFSFTVSPEAAASIHDEGLVILHIGSGQVYTSNSTGARIWLAVERKLSLEAIAKEISAAFQIALTTAREHAVRFLAELEQHALIQQEVVS